MLKSEEMAEVDERYLSEMNKYWNEYQEHLKLEGLGISNRDRELWEERRIQIIRKMQKCETWYISIDENPPIQKEEIERWYHRMSFKLKNHRCLIRPSPINRLLDNRVPYHLRYERHQRLLKCQEVYAALKSK